MYRNYFSKKEPLKGPMKIKRRQGLETGCRKTKNYEKKN